MGRVRSWGRNCEVVIVESLGARGEGGGGGGGAVGAKRCNG